MPHIRVLNGPNLNLLGTREPEIYGVDTLDDIQLKLAQLATKSEVETSFLQSNAEHEIIESIHAGRADKVDYFIINPGAFTHTSVAIRDAFAGIDLPFIEIHLSNTHARESFRHHSYLSDIAQGVIMGFGAQGYELAMQAAIQQLK